MVNRFRTNRCLNSNISVNEINLFINNVSYVEGLPVDANNDQSVDADEYRIELYCIHTWTKPWRKIPLTIHKVGIHKWNAGCHQKI